MWNASNHLRKNPMQFHSRCGKKATTPMSFMGAGCLLCSDLKYRSLCYQFGTCAVVAQLISWLIHDVFYQLYHQHHRRRCSYELQSFHTSEVYQIDNHAVSSRLFYRLGRRFSYSVVKTLQEFQKRHSIKANFGSFSSDADEIDTFHLRSPGGEIFDLKRILV